MIRCSKSHIDFSALLHGPGRQVPIMYTYTTPSIFFEFLKHKTVDIVVFTKNRLKWVSNMGNRKQKSIHFELPFLSSFSQLYMDFKLVILVKRWRICSRVLVFGEELLFASLPRKKYTISFFFAIEGYGSSISVLLSGTNYWSTSIWSAFSPSSSLSSSSSSSSDSH